MLADEGFALAGQVLPPVSMHFSAVPMTLVVSPRDRIEFAVQLELNALPVEERERWKGRSIRRWTCPRSLCHWAG